jgi:prepilin-type N-terminal cleavage/methylation domain-containing protein
MIKTDRLHRQKGFTIVEVMIATLVFGTVLLLVTSAILQFTRVYYKGVTESNVQDTARTITDLISQSIQFNGGTVNTTTASPSPGTYYAFCIGGQRYSYTTGWELAGAYNASKHQIPHVLVVDNYAGCNGSTPTAQNLNGGVLGRELLGSSMRLARLQVTNIGTNLYTVSVRVVYGDDDLLNGPTSATAKCQTYSSGTQFCAFSDITTTVVKRVQ